MYAVIATGGKQYRVQKGDVLRVEKLAVEPGASIDFDVLMLGGESPKIGTPKVDGAKVTATVLREAKHKRVISFKKWKNGWSKIRGHRQIFTELEITSIEG